MKRFLFLLVIAALPRLADARVQRVEILSRGDVLEGKAFGDAGAYEKLTGKVHFAVKPEATPNKLIVDLEKAPRNKAGEVGFAADFYILRPKEAAHSSGSVLLEIPNRGGKGILAIMQGGKGSRDPTTEEEFGDGFLMRRGVTVALLGWQWDVREEPNMLRLYAPVAHEADGESIVGLVRADFVPNQRMAEHPLGHLISGSIGGTEYACSDPDDSANVLTVRDAPLAKRRAIPRSEWVFSEDRRSIRLNGGFEPGKIYEAVYRARDPVIAGLGFAAVRDFAAYLKQPKNELGPAERVYSLGISQSGRFLRHFLLEGFNVDEAGKRAIDGMFVHVAGAGIGSFNHRFAQPSRDAQPTTALFYPTDLFPFADTPQTDPVTGQTGGLFDRLGGVSGDVGHGRDERSRLQRDADGATQRELLPKIFYTNTSYEYWSRAASLIHTSPDGKRDLPLMDNVRIYLLAGLQHFSGPFPPVRESERGLASANLPNPNPVRWFWRALLVAMDGWVRDETAPPDSRYPKLADKTLVRREEVKFPKIPGVAMPERVHQALRLDFGPQWKKRIITKQPPGIGKAFPALVPQVDKDGNDLGGVRLPELAVPLATCTGWNLRDPKSGMPDERVSFLGSFFPLPKTKEEAEHVGDPRPSTAERYSGAEEYLYKFRVAASQLAHDRFVLWDDIEAMVKRGREEWDYVAK